MLAKTFWSIVCGLWVALVFSGTAEGQGTARVSVNSAGAQGNADSAAPSVSTNARYVVFGSEATNLVAGDTNGVSDVFVHDRQTGQTVVASVDSNGTLGNGRSDYPAISADGRYVVFQSDATNLVYGDTNGTTDIFVHDLQLGITTRVSTSTSGAQAVGGGSYNWSQSISDDGRFVPFLSAATNLVTGDTNAVLDVFVHDRQTGQTTRVSVSSTGIQSNGVSDSVSISADGRYVAFDSHATNLVPGDTNVRTDVFVHDRQFSQTTRVSVSSTGLQSNGHSGDPSISADGRYAAFHSFASNLVFGDTNNTFDIFIRDQLTGTTTRVGLSNSGLQGNASSTGARISADGLTVAFYSFASNLVPGDINNAVDAFLHCLQTAQTTRVSSGPGGIQGDANSAPGALSADGRYVVFSSAATNLVLGDSNGRTDVFVRDTWSCYSDGDADGFGAGPPMMSSGFGCGVGYSSIGGDCDDFDPAINPGAAELCNGSDENCNGATDEGLVFLDYFLDADGDGYGAPGFSVSSCSAIPGHVSNADDCDDSRASVHPGAVELCNGIDDDCDGTVDEGFISTYCTAGTTVHGCVPTIAGIGAPSSASGSGFEIVVAHVPGDQRGIIYYGFLPLYSTPWAFGSSSWRCIGSFVQRMNNMPTGGLVGTCDGELRLDFNAWLQANPGSLGSPYTPGQVFCCQSWFRDPGAPTGTNLSDALKFTLCN